jgi:zinc/manganese transport system substrate-binding protein
MLARLCLILSVLWTWPAAAEPLAVVASFSILGDMVRQVGGDDVRVTTLAGAGIDAHGYQPGPGDARLVAGADLVVVNGLAFDGWLNRLMVAAGYRGRVVAASEGIVPIGVDPHAWQDIANGRRYAANIAAGLIAAAPERRARFELHLQAYDRRLAELESWVRREMETVPRAKRRIITGHEAFGYFARAYGMAVLAPAGLSTEAEPSPKALARLIRQSRDEHVKAMFLENMADPRLIRQLARDSGAVIGGTLYSDSLSAPDGPAPTYEAMFRHNVAALVAAMGRN